MKIKLKASVTLGSAKGGDAKEHAAGTVVDVDKKLAASLITAEAAEAVGASADAKAEASAPAPAAPTPAPSPAAP